MREDQVLCACSAYERKYYLNPRFHSLPEQIQNELQILAVTMTEDVGGVFTMELSAVAREDDLAYDEIGSHLKIKQYQSRYAELMEELEEYYRTFFLSRDGVDIQREECGE